MGVLDEEEDPNAYDFGFEYEDAFGYAFDNIEEWKTGTIEFLESLRDSWEQYGRLTEKQLERLRQILGELGYSR